MKTKIKTRLERTEHALITGGVFEAEQTLTKERPFWVFFMGNLGIGPWLMGVLLAGYHLSFTNAMFILLLAAVLGSILPAALALLGPTTRLSQMEASRFALGRTGKYLPSFLNWVGAIGWDVINNILSAAALTAFTVGAGVPIPFWAALLILVLLQMVMGIYGHHFIQDTSKAMGAVLGVLFVTIGLIVMHKIGPLPGTEVTHETTKDLFGAFVLLMAFNISGWTTYTADYTRYLPSSTLPRDIFATVFWGLFLSFYIFALFGYVSAPLVTEQTPEGVMSALQSISGIFAPLVLLLIAFTSIPANAINDNSAAYSLMSSGIKVSRPVAAGMGAILGYGVCLLASKSFIDFFENFLFIFAHWITPFSAIVLVHWFIKGNREQITPKGITSGAILLVVTSVASILLFSNNSLYHGYLSEIVGGFDIGPIIGFFVAAFSYVLILKWLPVRYKLVPKPKE